MAGLALLLMVAPATAQELLLPDALLGRWETIPENCANDAPETGVSLEFLRDDGADTLSMIDWSTEGSGCDVVMVDGSLPSLTVYGNCAAEEGPREAQTFSLLLGPNGELAYDGRSFTRCD